MDKEMQMDGGGGGKKLPAKKKRKPQPELRKAIRAGRTFRKKPKAGFAEEARRFIMKTPFHNPTGLGIVSKIASGVVAGKKKAKK